MVKDILLRLYIEGVKPMVSLVTPKGKDEKTLFVFILLYFYLFLFLTLYLRNYGMPVTLMGYDTVQNSSEFYFPYIHCWHLRHPLMALFSLPISLVRLLFTYVCEDPGWIIYVLPMPFITSLSCLLIYKIQKCLVIRRLIALCTTVLFGGFAHVILLSGQYESFPISLLFLLLFTIYELKQEKNIVCDNILLAAITGVTSTNVLKILLSWIVTSKLVSSIKRLWKSSALFALLMVVPTLQLILASIKHGDFWGHFITNATGFIYHEYDTCSILWNNFLCEPLFFHNIGKIFYDPEVILNNTPGAFCSSMDSYNNTIITGCIILIYFSVICSWAIFRKSKIVQLCLSYLVVDIFILLVLGYGKNEAQLYCLHWIFCIPIALGMLLNSIVKRYARVFSVIVLGGITIYCCGYNAMAFVESLYNPTMPNDYDYQLRFLQGMTKKHQNVTSYRFFLFGMGNRTKMVYKDGKLFDIDNDSIIEDFSKDFLKDSIMPDQYIVSITKKDGTIISIKEDENGVVVEEKGKIDTISGTFSKVYLPSFDEYRYGKVLKVLHHEVLLNIKNHLLYPNIFAYDSVWYRDAAMGVMVLNKTHNLSLVKKGIDSLSAIYDNQNANKEGDNIGEYLFMKSIEKCDISNMKDILLSEIQKRTKNSEDKVYIMGITDGVENDYYATAWLKYALKKSKDIVDVYTYPDNGGGYKYLCWFAEKPGIMSSIRHLIQSCYAKNTHDYPYPYLDWAVSHSFSDMQVPVAEGRYPLSWESKGSQADFSNIYSIVSDIKGKSICFPHLWTASEMFLYLLEFKK